MSDRDQRIVGAAIQVMKRYGYSRSTMNDIALEAGVSRRTLYSVFPSKAAVLQAAIRFDAAERLDSLRARSAEAKSFEQRLDIVFEKLVFEPRAKLEESPDAADLIRVIHADAQGEVERKHEAYRETLALVFAPFADRIEQAGLTVERLAGFVELSCRSCLDETIDRARLEEQMAVLKTVLANTIGDV